MNDLATPLASAPVCPMTLVEIGEHLEALLDSLEMVADDPAAREECEQEIAKYLSRQLAKIDRMAEFQDSLEAHIQLRRKQVQLLEKANRRAFMILERIDDAVLRAMDAAGRRSLEGSLYSFTQRKLPPSVEVINQAVVPPQYIRTTISESVDKLAAKVDLRNGIAIPGLEYVTDRRGVTRK